MHSSSIPSSALYQPICDSMNYGNELVCILCVCHSWGSPSSIPGKGGHHVLLVAPSCNSIFNLAKTFHITPVLLRLAESIQSVVMTLDLPVQLELFRCSFHCMYVCVWCFCGSDHKRVRGHEVPEEHLSDTLSR